MQICLLYIFKAQWAGKGGHSNGCMYFLPVKIRLLYVYIRQHGKERGVTIMEISVFLAGKNSPSVYKAPWAGKGGHNNGNGCIPGQ
jgi:hypothetical protein